MVKKTFTESGRDLKMIKKTKIALEADGTLATADTNGSSELALPSDILKRLKV